MKTNKVKVHQFKDAVIHEEMQNRFGISRTYMEYIEMPELRDENGEYGHAIVYNSTGELSVEVDYFRDGSTIYVKDLHMRVNFRNAAPLLAALSYHLWSVFYQDTLHHVVFLLHQRDEMLKSIFKNSTQFTMSEGDGDLIVYSFGVNVAPDVDRTLPFISQFIKDAKIVNTDTTFVPFTMTPIDDLKQITDIEGLTDIQLQIEKVDDEVFNEYKCYVTYKKKPAVKFNFAVFEDEEYLLFNSLDLAKTSDIDVETFKKIIRTLCVFLSITFASKTKGNVGFFIGKEYPADFKMKKVLDSMGDFFIVTETKDDENVLAYTYNYNLHSQKLKLEMGKPSKVTEENDMMAGWREGSLNVEVDENDKSQTKAFYGALNDALNKRKEGNK